MKKTSPTPMVAKSGQKIRLDDITTKVISDPHKNDTHTLLKGYIGKSSLEKHIRVYFDIQLNNFIEVPVSGVAHCMELSATESPLGGSLLWIERSASIVFGKPQDKERPIIKFLEGDIYTAYLNKNGHIKQNHQGSLDTTFTADGSCLTLGACVTICPTTNPPCGTTEFCFTRFCPSQYCPTTDACFTQSFCPTVPACLQVMATEIPCTTIGPCHTMSCPVTSFNCPSHDINCPPPVTADGTCQTVSGCPTSGCPTGSQCNTSSCPSQPCPSNSCIPTNGCFTQSFGCPTSLANCNTSLCTQAACPTRGCQTQSCTSTCPSNGHGCTILCPGLTQSNCPGTTTFNCPGQTLHCPGTTQVGCPTLLGCHRTQLCSGSCPTLSCHMQGMFMPNDWGVFNPYYYFGHK